MQPTGLLSGWLLDTYVPHCNNCMDNQGHYCDTQPAAGELYQTTDGPSLSNGKLWNAFSGRPLVHQMSFLCQSPTTGQKCFSRFECTEGTNSTWAGLHFSCVCGSDVKPIMEADQCRTACLDLNTDTGLTNTGTCPTTCYDCAGVASRSEPNVAHHHDELLCDSHYVDTISVKRPS